MSPREEADRPEAPYEALEAVIRRELQLVAARRFDRLPAIKRERAAIVKLIAPLSPPPEAQPALERCLQLQREIAAELGTARAQVVRDLRRVRQARRAAAGYAPVHAARPRVVTSA
ncbi:MAG TPA: hypothetical protein VKV21_14620 [Solirubrobacteraceae bacterium]|nr:hypothetical protein [Solirubrobacteraceae bacterium]